CRRRSEMALGANATITTNIDKGSRIFNLGNGCKQCLVDLGLVTAASVIVTGGITLDATDTKRLGFAKLLTVEPVAAWKSDNTLVPCQGVWNGKTGKLMLYTPGGVALVATDIADGGTIRLTVFGV